MYDLDKRVRSNPFIKDAIDIFGKSNYHLVRSEYAKHGGVKLIVAMDDKDGIERDYPFTFPARMDNLHHLRWKDGLRENIKHLESLGYRPPRSQLAPRAISQDMMVRSPPSRLRDDAEKLWSAVHKEVERSTNPEPEAEVQPVVVGNTKQRIVTMLVDASNVPTILATLDGVAEVLEIRHVNPVLAPEPVIPVSEPVIPAVCEAVEVAVDAKVSDEPVKVKAKPKKVFVDVEGGMLGLITRSLPAGEFSVEDILPEITPKFGHLSAADIRRRTSTHLSFLFKEKVLDRVDTGRYRRRGDGK